MEAVLKMGGVLLDTCALIWTVEGAKISDSAKSIISSQSSDVSLNINPMSAWEVGMLVSKGRISLTMNVEKWFARIINSPFFSLANLTPSVLIQSTDLPAQPPKDPVDRMMIALARENDWKIMTRDREILSYGQQGHVRTIEC